MDKGPFKCDLCNVISVDENNFKAHINGNKHKKKELVARKISEDEQKSKCSVFVTGFNYPRNQHEIIKKFSRIGKIVTHYFNADKVFAIFQFENEYVAKRVLQSRVKIDGRDLIIKPKFHNKDGKFQTPASKKDPSNENQDQIHNILNTTSNFDQQLERFMSELQLPLHIMSQRYSHVCRDLEQILQTKFPNCRAHPFGSTITGLGFKQSDLDVYIEVGQYNSLKPTFASDFTKISKNILQKSSLFTNVFAIPKAKTPIVKCIHAPTRVSCDFNFKSMLGVCNSRLIKFLFSSNSCILATMIIIKYWAKKFEISGTGKLTNYSLAMLYIFFLQTCEEPYFPSIYSMQLAKEYAFIQEGWNGGFCPDKRLIPFCSIPPVVLVPQLLLGFFSYYSSFDYGIWVISPLMGKPIAKSNFLDFNNLPNELFYYKKKLATAKDVEPMKVNTAICVQDPFVLTHNITSYIMPKLLKDFQTLCKHSAETILSVKDVPNKVLLTLLFTVPKPQNTIAEVCNNHICVFRIPFSPDMIFTRVERDIQDKPRILSTIWFDMLHTFLVSVLEKVFLLDVSVQKESSLKKAMKIEGKSDVHDNDIVDVVAFHCKGYINVWEARKSISKSFDIANKTEFISIVDKEIMVSDYIANVVYKGMKLNDPIVHFEFVYTSKRNPIEATFEVKNIKSGKVYFKVMAQCLANLIPLWFDKHIKESKFTEIHSTNNVTTANELKIETETINEIHIKTEPVDSGDGRTSERKYENETNKFLVSIEKIQKIDSADDDVQ